MTKHFLTLDFDARETHHLVMQESSSPPDDAILLVHGLDYETAVVGARDEIATALHVGDDSEDQYNAVDAVRRALYKL